MKKFLVALIVVSMLGFNSIAFAAEEGQAVQQEEQTVDAGITPDSILYSADKLFEDLQLLITTDSEKEAELLLQFAKERLAEAKEMSEEDKVEFVKSAMDAYIETLDKAEEKVTEVALDENTSEEVKEELTEDLEETAEVDEDIEEDLDDEQQEELEEKTEEVSYTANVVKDLDVEIVKALREEGMGFGNIAHTVALSRLSGKSVDEIAAMMKEGKGVGNIAKELGLHPSDKNKKIAIEEEDEDTEEAGEENSAEEAVNEDETGEAEVVDEASETAENNTSEDANKNETIKAAALKAPSTVENKKDESKAQNQGEIKSNDNKKDNQEEAAIGEKDDNKGEAKETKGNNGKANKGGKGK